MAALSLVRSFVSADRAITAPSSPLMEQATLACSRPGRRTVEPRRRSHGSGGRRRCENPLEQLTTRELLGRVLARVDVLLEGVHSDDLAAREDAGGEASAVQAARVEPRGEALLLKSCVKARVRTMDQLVT